MKKDVIKKRLLSTLAIMFLPVFMYVLLGPTEAYVSNLMDFDFLLSDFIYIFILIAVVLWIVGSAVLLILPENIYNIICSLIFSFSISSYVQNNFLNTKLSEKDGSSMDWEALKNVTITNLFIWIFMMVLFFAVSYALKKTKFTYYVSVFLIIIQFAGLISSIINYNSAGKVIPHYQLSAENQFDVASKENIIVILTDTVGNKVFDEYYDKEPETFACLNDFTYFNNYDSLYTPTFPSISHMLTGYDPDTLDTRYEWARRAWMSDNCSSFYDVMHENNYVCNIFSKSQTYTFGDIETLINKADNIITINAKVNVRLMIPMMLKYSIFKYCPYVAKPRFEVIPIYFRGVVVYDIDDEAAELNSDFYNRLKADGLELNENYEKAFIFQHLNGLHNSDDAPAEEGVGIDAKIHTTYKAVDEYLNQLKAIGVYDSSTIIICSDHGTHYDDYDKQATFFIKEKNEKHDNMVINSAPVTSDEFQSTVLRAAGIDYSLFGTSVYDWDEDSIRERTTFVNDNSLSIGGLYGYTYSGNRLDLIKTFEDGYDVEYPSMGW